MVFAISTHGGDYLAKIAVRPERTGLANFRRLPRLALALTIENYGLILAFALILNGYVSLMNLKHKYLQPGSPSGVVECVGPTSITRLVAH